MKAHWGIKLTRHPVVGALALALAGLTAACGSGDTATGGGGSGGGGASGGSAGSGGSDAGAPCQGAGGSSGHVTQVDIALDSPLPPELSTQCPQGDPTQLEGMLLLGAKACTGMTVSGERITGCCPNIPADQNYTVTLTFRVRSTQSPVGEQSKLLQLPSNSPPVVPLSFSGVAVENFAKNRDAWCH